MVVSGANGYTVCTHHDRWGGGEGGGGGGRRKKSARTCTQNDGVTGAARDMNYARCWWPSWRADRFHAPGGHEASVTKTFDAFARLLGFIASKYNAKN